MSRFGSAFIVALVIVVGLFWIMQAMISSGKNNPSSEKQSSMDFVRIQPKQSPKQDASRQPPPPPPDMPPPPPPPPPMSVSNTRATVPDKLEFDMPRVRPEFDLSLISLAPVKSGPPENFGPVMYEGALIPLSQTPPQYPPRALSRGIEGWVRMSFVIAPDGSVTDIEIIQAHPRPGVFDDSARRALSRWRFRAYTVAGQAVASRAEITLNFSLTGG